MITRVVKPEGLHPHLVDFAEGGVVLHDEGVADAQVGPEVDHVMPQDNLFQQVCAQRRHVLRRQVQGLYRLRISDTHAPSSKPPGTATTGHLQFSEPGTW